MSQVLNNLHADHKNFQKLLEYLEVQLHLLENCEHPDLEAINDAIRYMKEYPDFIHHPLEDGIFKYYLESYNDNHEMFQKLLHEHELMPSLTEKLLEILQAALVDVPQDRKLLCSYLKKYISIQREHMNLEEREVYPILNSRLKDNDWVKIEALFNSAHDPLFGKQVEKSYLSLLNKIV